MVPRPVLAPRRAVAARALLAGALAATLVAPAAAPADPVAVRHGEGVAHGFVTVSTLEGVHIGDGDLVQTTRRTPRGNRVKAHLTLHFKDGSLHDETTVYLQQRTFRLVSYHLVQRGGAFQRQVEAHLDARGEVRGRYSEEDREEHELHETLKLPADVANGMTLVILRNLSPETPKTTVSFVALAPKPRLVQLEITPRGEEPFTTGEKARRAQHYVLHVHVPGVAGVAASVLGKIPEDTHVWVVTGEAPAFVKAELPLAPDGPVWRIEMEKATWPRAHDAARGER